jgi:hypothetical protein
VPHSAHTQPSVLRSSFGLLSGYIGHIITLYVIIAVVFDESGNKMQMVYGMTVNFL